MELKIKNKRIGKNNPTFVIAEAGINHNGNLKIAKKLILKAAEIGSDAIKFQTFTASDLTSTKSKYYKIFKKLELNESQFGENDNWDLRISAEGDFKHIAARIHKMNRGVSDE